MLFNIMQMYYINTHIMYLQMVCEYLSIYTYVYIYNIECIALPNYDILEPGSSFL